MSSDYFICYSFDKITSSISFSIAISSSSSSAFLLLILLLLPHLHLAFLLSCLFSSDMSCYVLDVAMIACKSQWTVESKYTIKQGKI